jgi:hypothetical protein
MVDKEGNSYHDKEGSNVLDSRGPDLTQISLGGDSSGSNRISRNVTDGGKLAMEPNFGQRLQNKRVRRTRTKKTRENTISSTSVLNFEGVLSCQ